MVMEFLFTRCFDYRRAYHEFRIMIKIQDEFGLSLEFGSKSFSSMPSFLFSQLCSSFGDLSPQPPEYRVTSHLLSKFLMSTVSLVYLFSDSVCLSLLHRLFALFSLGFILVSSL